MKKKRRLNPKLIKPLKILGVILAIIAVICFVRTLINGDDSKSVNSGARKYKTNSCTVFYPNSSYGKQYAKSICEGNDIENAVYDYSLIPYGDNYLVDYGDGKNYMTDGKFNLLNIDAINEDGKFILSDYLRYSMKKDEIDEAYTLDFLNDTYYENLDISGCTYTISSNNLDVYFPQYDCTVSIPLKYIGKYLDIDLGIQQETYVKPTYVSSKRKTVCLTFNNGPSITTTPDVIDVLYKYDAVGTFFVIGDCVNDTTIDIINNAIEKGNQIGSLTQSGYNLYLCETDEDVINEIKQPAEDILNGRIGDDGYSGTGYVIDVYRAPGGDHTKIDDIAPLMGVQWDLDLDKSDDSTVDSIVAALENFKSKNPDELNECILVLRDEDTRAVCSDALETIIPDLIEDGYQIITVDELLDILGEDIAPGNSYPW